jgi:hypothetical protein
MIPASGMSCDEADLVDNEKAAAGARRLPRSARTRSSLPAHPIRDQRLTSFVLASDQFVHREACNLDNSLFSVMAVGSQDEMG